MTSPSEVPAAPVDLAETATFPTTAVELRGVTKRFGDAAARDTSTCWSGEARSMGCPARNGAGKSTLMKVLLGLITPDAGSILIDGEPVVVEDPLAAATLGIAMVHQHFSVIEPRRPRRFPRRGRPACSR